MFGETARSDLIDSQRESDGLDKKNSKHDLLNAEILKLYMPFPNVAQSQGFFPRYHRPQTLKYGMRGRLKPAPTTNELNWTTTHPHSRIRRENPSNSIDFFAFFIRFDCFLSIYSSRLSSPRARLFSSAAKSMEIDGSTRRTDELE